MSHKTDEDIIRESHDNIPRFCVDYQQVSWVLLILTFLWGLLGYTSMPQRKDPDVPVKKAAASCNWPGATAEQIEQQVTRKIEAAINQNSYVKVTYSTTTTGTTTVRMDLDDNLKDTREQISDINLKLANVTNLPPGAGPVQFNGDFGDTAALMLTVASPRMKVSELGPRVRAIQTEMRRIRVGRPGQGKWQPFTMVLNYPTSMGPNLVEDPAREAAHWFMARGLARDLRIIGGPGFIGLDGLTDRTDTQVMTSAEGYVRDRLQELQVHPDSWDPMIVHEPEQVPEALAAVAGPKYSYRELDDFTDMLERGFRALDIVAKVQRSGVLSQTVYLNYSQDRLAAYGVKASDLSSLLAARNITTPGGQMQTNDRTVSVYPTGLLTSADQIGNMLMTVTSTGTPVYMRDLVTVVDGYQTPPTFLSYLTIKDEKGRFQRLRAVTLAVQMKSGRQITTFGQEVDQMMAGLLKNLPSDLVVDKTSNQPEQVSQKVDLLMTSLWKAILLVVLVSLIGFWDWRSASLMALSVPITLSMTFGMMYFMGIDLQQVSIATLIIALGLLVDDPVVAGDAIKRSMGEGHPKKTAAWLGPTKLATATTFATITNIVAYLPFLGISGDTGAFLYSLPVVLTCSLVASRIVSMTFVPFLGYFMLRPVKEPPLSEVRSHGFPAFYARVVLAAVEHRWKVLAGSMVFLGAGFFVLSRLPTQFFPMDLNPIFYVDVWAPENAPLTVTNQAAEKAEAIIHKVAGEYAAAHGEKESPLHSIATYVGGGSPRFWSSLSPQQPQLNYAQVTVLLNRQEDTPPLADMLQGRMFGAMPGVTMDVRRLQSGKPVDMPIQVRILGEDIPTLRILATRCKEIFRKVPVATRIRDDWGVDSLNVSMDTDSDRANMAGFTNYDVAASSYNGLSGGTVGAMRVGHKVIPIVARMKLPGRSQLSDLDNLYVFSQHSSNKTPLNQVSTVNLGMQTSQILRRWQHRCITVGCFPMPGRLASEVMKAAKPDLDAFIKSLPPGNVVYIDGEQRQQQDGFKNLIVVMLISVVMIYMSLVFQFKNGIKPFIVFAAVPYGMAGAFFGLYIMGTPFGFMAFLGVISLMGVIVSHIIVLFDFIEEAHAKGEGFIQSLVDAGVMRLRPVMITVGATITALFPLATDGGPLWEPLCYAQIGGLGVATFITLLLVPVLYVTAVTDLKILTWEEKGAEAEPSAPAHEEGHPA